MILQPIWTRSTPGRLLGIALAREARFVLSWDVAHRLLLWDIHGKLLAEQALHAPIAAAGISDDGRTIVAALRSRAELWFDAQLRLLFDRPHPHAITAMAVEPLGGYSAVATDDRRTVVTNRQGTILLSYESPRALRHLTFVPARPWLIGAAEFGLVACLDEMGRCRWTDRPLSHVGSISSDESSDRVLLACFSSGMRRYDADGKIQDIPVTDGPCCLAVQDCSGNHVLTVSEHGTLSLRNGQGRVIESLAVPGRVAALAMGALGELGVYGLAEGEITALTISNRP